MELQNTEPKVQMKQGYEYVEIDALPPVGEIKSFTGDETGKIIPDENINADEIKVHLDIGKIVITKSDAVDEIQNLLDANTKDDFINVGTNDTGMSLY